MSKIKLCGLSRTCDIDEANLLKVDFIGFVFATKSRRYVNYEQASLLKQRLNPQIKAVGVFVDEDVNTVVSLFDKGIIDIAQLHGHEDEAYINKLRKLTSKPLIQAFYIQSANEVAKAIDSSADYILLDSGAGTGEVFNWDLIKDIKRDYFLAGGLTPDNVADAITRLHPFAVDVSSGIESNHLKDKNKMRSFVAAVKKDKDYE